MIQLKQLSITIRSLGMDRTSRPTKDRRNLYYARQRKKNYVWSNDDCAICNLACGIVIYTASWKCHDVLHSITDYFVQIEI